MGDVQDCLQEPTANLSSRCHGDLEFELVQMEPEYQNTSTCPCAHAYFGAIQNDIAALTLPKGQTIAEM